MDFSVPIALWTCLSLFGLSVPAFAASFDCKNARRPLEQAICADPTVSAADEKLATAYRDAQKRRSSAGQLAFRESERSFLQYATDLCRPGDQPINVPNDTVGATPLSNKTLVSQCLTDAFGERTEVLGRSVIVLGGHTFLLTTTYHVHASSFAGFDGKTYRQDTHSIVQLLQIDLPRTKVDDDWNAANRTWVQQDLVGGYSETGNDDCDVYTTLLSASPDFVAEAIGVSTYTKGAPHPNYQEVARSWSLRLGRLLRGSDVFLNEHAWNAALVPVVRSQIRRRFDGGEIDRNDVKTVASIESWDILPAGIEFRFGEYELGGYTSATSTLLTWKAVNPYLLRSLPFRPEELQAPPSPAGNNSAR